MPAALIRWIDRNILALAREMRLSYLPPLMVYMALGVSGLTGIVGTFFVKDHLGLSAAFLASLGFWVGIPWALKMPLGHLVDLLWRWKDLLVYLGATLIAASLAIMAMLIGSREAMAAIMPVESWFVLSELLAPVGFALQDAVADAMTVEAVPRFGPDGRPVDGAQRKLMHTTVQTLGRVAIIGGTVLVALVNLYAFADVQALSEMDKVRVYREIYLMAMVIPAVSVAGVVLAAVLKAREARRLRARGLAEAEIATRLDARTSPPAPNAWILGGGLAFVVFTITIGLADLEFGQEIIFAGSFAIVVFLMTKLTRELEADARATLVGTAVVIFIFRAIPGPGPGATWWMIDALGFDQQFLSVLSLTASVLTLAGMFVFRRFMAERSIACVIGFLTVCGFVLTAPVLGMYYGLHEWTARMTGGAVDARFIALANTALESPLNQIAMIPMLAWIANSAPENLKATYFAVMGSFTNLALSLSQLCTKYLNQAFVVTREVKDAATGAIKVPADYSALGELLITQAVLGLLLPLTAIAFARMSRFRSA